MHDAVKAAWHAFSEPLEGSVHWMYLDVRGLVTTGVGNLIDPVSEALKLPWKYKDGTPATKDAIAKAWRALKSQPELSKRHYRYAERITNLYLSDEDIDALVDQRMRSNEEYFAKTLVGFASFPADAQLAIHSMAWAVGAGFTAKFPNFTRAAVTQDWVAARAACLIRTAGNPGVVPRNKQNQLCFDNAALVAARAFPRHGLYWPLSLRVELEKGDTEPPARPEQPTAPDGPTAKDLERLQQVTHAVMQDDYLGQKPSELREPYDKKDNNA